MSNASGSFATPTTLTAVPGAAGSFTVTIPAGTTPGTGYKIRVNSSDPAITGTASTPTLTVVAPPAITTTTIAPVSVAAGANATVSYTSTGTFGAGNTFTAELSDATGAFPGTALTTVSSTASSLLVTIPAGTAPGTAYKIRVNGSTPATVGTASTTTLTVTAPPAISGFAPGNGPVGTVVTIDGSNFTNAATVSFNGTAATAVTFVNSGQLTATVPAGATTGTIQITVGGVTTTSATAFTVDPTPNPVPSITTLTPATAVAGGAAFTLTVNGNNFVSNSEVSFNGVPLTTTFVTASRVTAAVPASAIGTAGTYDVTVTNPLPGGGTSAPTTFTVTTPAAAGQVVISQVYGAGGNSGATYRQDYVELFNRGATTVDLTGYTIEYFSSGGGSGGSLALTGSVGAGRYYLIQLGGVNSGFTALPTPDQNSPASGSGSITMGATAGRVDLSNGTVLIDRVGYGPATSFEGTGPASAPSNTNAIFRSSNGCIDTNNNAADFTVAAAAPRNSATAANVCAPQLTATPAALTGFFTAPGTASASQSYTLQGSTLSNSGSIDVAVPAGSAFEVSADNATFGPTASISYTGTSLPTTPAPTVYVRLAASAALGTYTGVSITNTANPGAVATASVTVSGMVSSTAAEPTTSATAVSFASIGTNAVRVTFAGGNGQRRLLLVREGSAVTANPVDGLGYAANRTFGLGDQVGAGNYVVYANTGTAVTVTGLNPGTRYFFIAYEYNGTSTTANYREPGTANDVTTLPVPAVNGTGELVFEEYFRYPTGTELTTQGWTEVSGGITNPIKASGPALDFTEYGAPRVDGSSAVRLNNTGQDVSRTINRTVNAGATYVSFLATVVSVGTNNEYFFALLPSGSTTFTGRVHLREGSAANTFNAGISFTGSTGDLNRIAYVEDAAGNVVNFSKADAHLFVVRYTRNSGTSDDQVRLYVQSGGTVPRSEPETGQNFAEVQLGTSNIGGNTESTANPNAVLLRQYNLDQDIVVDGIRVGSGWGAVVGRPTFTNDNFALRTGTYYDVELSGSTTAVSVTGGPVRITNGLSLQQGRLLTTDANLVTLASGASAGPGTPNSFVDGPLARVYDNAGGARTFPIGRGGIFRAVDLSVTQPGDATYKLEMINATPPNSRDLAVGSDLEFISRVRYYRLERVSGTATSTVAVRLDYGPDDQVNDPANLRVVKSSNGAPYENLGPASGGSGTPDPGTANFTVGSILSNVAAESLDAPVFFTLGNATPGTNPLPVTLTTFTATAQDAGALLSWTTAQEKNSARFEVLRSLDGRTFHPIGSVAAAGTSTTTRRYSFLDRATPAGIAYYRLRQIDLDGTFTESHIVALTKAGRLVLSLYPNPVTDQLHLQAGVELVRWQVLNGLGQVLRQGTATGTATLDVAGLPAGVYYLQADAGKQRQVQKFVKN